MTYFIVSIVKNFTKHREWAFHGSEIVEPLVVTTENNSELFVC